jgi:hypothetical protein
MKGYLIYAEDNDRASLSSLKYVFFSKEEAESMIVKLRHDCDLYDQLCRDIHEFKKDIQSNIKNIPKRTPSSKEEAIEIAVEQFENSLANKTISGSILPRIAEYIEKSNYPKNIKDFCMESWVEDKSSYPEFYGESYELVVTEIEIIHKNMELE